MAFWGDFKFVGHFRGVEYSTDPQNIFPKILLTQSKSFLLDFVNLTKTKENMEDSGPPKKRSFLGGSFLKSHLTGIHLSMLSFMLFFIFFQKKIHFFMLRWIPVKCGLRRDPPPKKAVFGGGVKQSSIFSLVFVKLTKSKRKLLDWGNKIFGKIFFGCVEYSTPLKMTHKLKKSPKKAKKCHF